MQKRSDGIDKSSIVRLALEKLHQELERLELEESAELYAQIYAEDEDLRLSPIRQPWAMGVRSYLIFTPELSFGMGNTAQLILQNHQTEPLLGMVMLYGYRLQVDNVEGGIVKIEAL